MHSDLVGGAKVVSEYAPGSVSVGTQRTVWRPVPNMTKHSRFLKTEVLQVAMTPTWSMLKSLS